MSISIPGADYTPQLTGYTGQGAFRFWCQKVLPIVYDDSLSYYELLNKVVNYLNNVIADVANVEQNVGELNGSYISLQSYVNEHMQEIVDVVNEYTEFTTNYFNNLDVQEEINTKLDKMASDGSLSTLIGPIVAITAPDIITQWLTEHLTPTEPPVDDTLTIRRAAADAKVTGEKIANLESELTSTENLTNKSVRFNWEHGGIDNATGQTMDDGSLTRSRDTTYYRISELESLTNNSNSVVFIILYYESGGVFTFGANREVDANSTFTFGVNANVYDYARFDVRGSLAEASLVEAIYKKSEIVDTIEKVIEEVDNSKEHLFYNSKVLETEDGFFDYPIISGVRLTNTGETTEDTDYVTTDFIPVKYGIYVLSAVNYKSGFSVYRCIYDAEKNLIEYQYYDQYEADRTFTIRSENVAYVRYSVSLFTYNQGIEFRLIENLKNVVNRLERNVHGNLCGNDSTVFYPISLKTGDYLTLSTSDGSTPSYTELRFYDENYNQVNAYSLSGAKRTIQITAALSVSRYIKWLYTPSVPVMVEFGTVKTDYKEYVPNIFNVKALVENNDNVYTYAPLPIVAVMTYNVGEWYNGTRTQMDVADREMYKNLQDEILRKNYASILCTQEYFNRMYTDALDAKYMFLYPLYKNVYTLRDTELTRGKAVATNLWVESVETVTFKNQNGVAVDYQKAYIYINGKKVCVCNVHLSQLSDEYRLLEAQEIISEVSSEEYYIVCGDFNVNFNGISGTVAAQIIDAFSAIGAKACNGSTFGVFYTFRGSSVLGSSNEANDNIFVSSNINIKSVYMDTTKIDAQLPIQDHVPLVAYLEIF